MANENEQGTQSPSLNILAQYTKDLSFENPGAPRSLQSRDTAPAININVNVNANPLSETDFDVVLSLSVDAKDGDKVVFAAELVYGGVFRVTGFPQEHMLPVLFIECPRLLFPFARQIVAYGAGEGQVAGSGAQQLSSLRFEYSGSPGLSVRAF
jgi:preprotein translocase subunit SecB